MQWIRRQLDYAGMGTALGLHNVTLTGSTDNVAKEVPRVLSEFGPSVKTQIDKDWNGLQKRHRMEIAQAVARYCIGHKMSEVAGRLNYGKDWVQTQLDYAGIGVALGTEKTPLTGSTDNVAKEVPQLVKEFGLSVKADIGRGGESARLCWVEQWDRGSE